MPWLCIAGFICAQSIDFSINATLQTKICIVLIKLSSDQLWVAAGFSYTGSVSRGERSYYPSSNNPLIIIIILILACKFYLNQKSSTNINQWQPLKHWLNVMIQWWYLFSKKSKYCLVRSLLKEEENISGIFTPLMSNHYAWKWGCFCVSTTVLIVRAWCHTQLFRGYS